ncbi:MAG TPA: hypothetical protein VEY89_14195 [Candidatus Dormibacteraeota bacterium]|nr:hypothetical protein [Candidatus Dormibacteraeota bacterium]
MRAYLITTGTIFGLIFLAHMARLFIEGAERARDPIFLALTALAAGLVVWAWRVFAGLSKP